MSRCAGPADIPGGRGVSREIPLVPVNPGEYRRMFGDLVPHPARRAGRDPSETLGLTLDPIEPNRTGWRRRGQFELRYRNTL